jgi:hypothetical protein
MKNKQVVAGNGMAPGWIRSARSSNRGGEGRVTVLEPGLSNTLPELGN